MKTYQWQRQTYFRVSLISVLFLNLFSASHAMTSEPAPTWHLGTIDHKAKHDTIIKVIARAKPIIITKIQSNCSCLKGKVNKRAVQVGDTLEITLNYDAKDKGHFYKKLEIGGKGVKWEEIIVRGEVK